MIRAWRVTDCFCGPSCWCACVVDESGGEVIDYGNASRACCHAIVDAVNGEGTPGDHPSAFERYPLPWAAEDCGRGRWSIMTATMVGSNSLEGCICPATLDEANARAIVERVNLTYGGVAP